METRSPAGGTAVAFAGMTFRASASSDTQHNLRVDASHIYCWIHVATVMVLVMGVLQFARPTIQARFSCFASSCHEASIRAADIH